MRGAERQGATVDDLNLGGKVTVVLDTPDASPPGQADPNAEAEKRAKEGRV